jgi:predicted alpha-1,2-mannosidase
MKFDHGQLNDQETGSYRMISRRKFTANGAAALCLSWSHLRSEAARTKRTGAATGDEPGNVSQFVQPKIGTGGHGHCYPGATVPFGMVQLSPDTFNQGWDWCSGYNYSDSSIMGFSHTHLSGTGIGDMLDFLVMACTGPVKTIPGSRENPETGYRSRFSHEDEHSVPGYYSVLLRDYGVKAELSATARAGIHRYTFPKNQQSYLIVDLEHGYADGPGAVRWANLKVIGNDTLMGGKCTNRWASGREIYFTMKFSRPFDRIEVIADGKPVEDLSQDLSGKSLKAVLHYSTHDRESILVKTGISGVSAEGAKGNLEAEIPGWDFEGVRKAAADLWEKELSRIRVTGGTQKQREIFYTAFYHSMVAPTLFDDVDGTYRGMDGQNHKLPPGANNFSTYSLWDTYRAVHPLYTIAQPERVPALVNCLIRMANESPEGMPVWPLQAKETNCMTGFHSATVIAEAVRKGFPGIAIGDAYVAMKREADHSEIKGMPLYRKYGYIPCDLDQESVSRSLDYTYNNWAVSVVAEAAGAKEDSVAFRQRSLAYRALFDKSTGFMRPKLANGDWAVPFAPNEMGHQPHWRDYTESNPWESTFAVQHDPAGLADLFGGREQFAAKIDGIFNASSALPPDAPPDIAGLVGQYAHGNEPSHHIAYLYAYVGQAYKAQERLWSLMETMYDNQPNGLAGNEDCGQMSAWYVMSAMGFYAVDPISGNYVFGTPVFDKVTVDLGRGKQFVVEAKRSSESDHYIQGIQFNGAQYDRIWFSHQDLAKGGTFVLEMANKPNVAFGSDPKLAPPSISSPPTFMGA